MPGHKSKAIESNATENVWALQKNGDNNAMRMGKYFRIQQDLTEGNDF